LCRIVKCGPILAIDISVKMGSFTRNYRFSLSFNSGLAANLQRYLNLRHGVIEIQMCVQNHSVLVLTLLGGLACSLASGSAIADSQAPSRPNGVNAQAIDSSSVRVSWNQPWDNVGIEGYNIYRNNQYYTTVFNTNYIDYGVSSNSRYEYAIVAFDAAKNYTTLSDKVAVNVGGGNNNAQAATPVQTTRNQNASMPSALRSTVQNGNAAVINWNAPLHDLYLKH